MKNILRLIVFMAVLAWALPAHAQTVLNTTTANGSISATATSFLLTSASASSGSTVGAPAVGNMLFVDREGMLITAISSTRVTVQRAQMNTNNAIHVTGARIYTGPVGAFRANDPVFGACSIPTFPVRPWINTITGSMWLCLAGQVAGASVVPFTYNSVFVSF